MNRPFDDQSQDRIHLEAEAVLTMLKHTEFGDWEWVSSDAVTYEISKTPNDERRERLQSFNARSTSHISVNIEILKRAEEIVQMGFDTYDALHIACAEKAGADAFFSTDDKLVKIAKQNYKELKVNIENPLIWLQEVVWKWIPE